MKQKYIKNDTKQSVFAEQLDRVTRKRKSKKYEDEEILNTNEWRIEHEDGFVTALSNEKFLKRYTKSE